MNSYIEIPSLDYNFPNITVYQKLKDGIQYAWKITTHEGYVMYDTTADDKDYDEEGNAFPITYYYTVAHCPLDYDFTNFSWVALSKEYIPENLIF